MDDAEVRRAAKVALASIGMVAKRAKLNHVVSLGAKDKLILNIRFHSLVFTFDCILILVTYIFVICHTDKR